MIFAIVGKSGSGKTTVADYMKEKGVEPITSYTTRPARYEGENAHIFLTEEQFSKLGNVLAETTYGEHRYAGVFPKIKSYAYSYVITEDGLKTLLDKGLKVVSIFVGAFAKDRKMRTSPERFNRDKGLVHELNYDHYVFNTKSIKELKKSIDKILKYYD